MTALVSASAPTRVVEEEHDVRVMLVRFTVALNRRRAYAPTHPMVAQSDDGLRQALCALLAKRPSFTLGVAHRELLLDLTPVDGGGAAARELAQRLHRREVGAITFQRGVTDDAVAALLAWLAVDPHSAAVRPEHADEPHDPTPVSAHQHPDLPPVLPQIHVTRIAYDRLILEGGEPERDGTLTALWRALAAAALADAPAAPLHTRAAAATRHESASAAATRTLAADTLSAESRDGPPDALDAELDRLADAPAEELADAIAGRMHDAADARRVGVVLQTIASQMRTASPDVRREVATRLRAVLQRLGSSPLAAIIRASGDRVEQRRYVASLIDVLPAVAIVDWLEHMASSTEEQLSHHLLRILTKLSTHSGDRRTAPDRAQAFRETAQALIDGWELADPNPIAHSTLLDHIVAVREDLPPRPAAPPAGREEIGESERETPNEHVLRLVQMACEIDVAGAEALAAARTLVAGGHVALLLAILDAAPGRDAAAAVHETITSREPLLHAMLKEPFDAAAARALLQDIPFSTASTLLDALEHARVRSARRLLLNTLQSFGAPLLPLLQARLNADAPWYFIRNLLLLLRDVSSDASGPAHSTTPDASLRTFLDHPQEQVRIEALRVLLDAPGSRDLAIRRALEDRSPRLVAAAIDALAGGGEGQRDGPRPVPRDVAARLMRIAELPDLDAELAARSIRALGGASGPLVRDWLLAQVSRRTRLLRRRALADGPIAVAALQVLSTAYRNDPAAADALDLARQLAVRDPRRLAVASSSRDSTP